jgi:hypothetical protein
LKLLCESGAEMLHDNSKTRFAAILEFLRHALSERPVPVSRIETAAREAGLLGEGQRLTHAKLFKRAKAVLGIRSKRIGFGADGDWFWQLPRLTDSSSAPHDALVAPNLGSSCDAGPQPYETAAGEVRYQPDDDLRTLGNQDRSGVMVTAWGARVEGLDYHRPPAGNRPHRWRLFIDDCWAFLDPVTGLGQRAAKLRWDTFDLFGCHPVHPLLYLGSAGLLWPVNGGKVVEVHTSWANLGLRPD